jgi:23S rRNA (cytosine1962-C5)-methyltransferase
MDEYKKIILHKGKEFSIQRRHPWIFSGAIKVKDDIIIDGGVVKVYSSSNQFLAIGHYQDGSISVRILSFNDEVIDTDFYEEKIKKAFYYRKKINLTDSDHTNVFRLIFGEADGLPGLIIDNYNFHFVIQCHSIGMHKQINFIAEALSNIFKENIETIYDKSLETLPKEYSSTIKNGFLSGNSKNTVVKENGNDFLIDWVNGQKTGFFIDQRENRLLLASYSIGKKVLNTFCYTGGFSVYAAKAGAKEVHSIDVSKNAIELTNKNIELNNILNHTSTALDTFDFLKTAGKDYDIIVLDPPAFAKSRKVSHNAVMGYKRLNAEAIKIIKPGGIIFTFSCSQVINRELFFNTITAAAMEAKRNVKILHYLSQPADHPISLFFPEGEYLKGLVIYVD